MSRLAEGLRVGFVKQAFVPTQAVVSQQIVRGLRDQGAHVRIVTGTATTAEGTRSAGAPVLRVTRECWDGIEIVRLPCWPSHDRSARRRAATYASYSATSVALGAWAFRGLDVLLVYGSPVTAAGAPMAWTRAIDLPYVLHVQDLWPDSVFATGFSRPGESGQIERLMNGFVQSAYRRAAAVVAISPGMRQVL